MFAKISIVSVLCLLLLSPAYADGLREYIYGDDGLIATETVDSVCAYSLSSSGASPSFNGVNGTFNVTQTGGSGCSWVATKNVYWITITGGGSGSGNGTVSYSVAANYYGPARTGIINAGGQIFTVSQAGMTCQQSCSYQAQLVVNEMQAACPDNCMQQILTNYPACAYYASNQCFDLLDGCVNSCTQEASQAGAYHYQQCTEICN